MAASGKQLKVVVVTPERAVLDETADMVVLPMFDGERGVQAGHSAFVGQLGPGELRISQGGPPKRFFIEGGFVQVSSNVVNVLTGKATSADKVTADAAAKALAAAEGMPSATPVERDSRSNALARARGMAAVARRNS
jgi:F-type H+-transporting ATPase subunit epsilon